MANAPDTLREAIKQGLQKAGWQSPTDDMLRQVEFAVNTWLGDRGNDGEKELSREEAVEALLNGGPALTKIQIRGIIAKCQG